MPRPAPARVLAVATGTVVLLVAALLAGPASAEPEADGTSSVDGALDGARAAEVSTAAEVARLDVAVAAAEAEATAAEVSLAQAAERYTDAAVLLEDREDAAAVARRASADAETALADARTAMTAVVRETYRGSGDLTAVAGVLAPGGVQVLGDRLVTLRALGARRDRVLQQVAAHGLVADVLAAEAGRALEQAEVAAVALEQARRDAEAEQARSEAVAADRRAEQERLVLELAALRDTTVALERQRQDELAQQRREREEAEALARSAEVVLAAGAGTGEPRAKEPAAARSSRSPLAEEPGEVGAPTSPPPPSPAAASSAAPAPSASVTSRPPAPATTASAPRTTTTAPAPRTTTTAPASRTTTTAPAPRTTTTAPAPRTTTTTPAPRTSTTAPAPAPAPSGSSRSTASQGQQAVAWARTQIGKPYRYGGNGPDSYDCSGLTGNAWRNAGVGIPRTSRDQFAATARVPLSSLRPGDLIFWASNPRDHRTIYHVAMYSGGGMMVEAPSSGKTVREVPVRWGGTMPTGGRP